MEERVCRKLHLSDLEMVLKMDGDFRNSFIFKTNARQFLSDPMNWIFACKLYEKAGCNKISDAYDDDVTYFFNEFN